MSDSMKGNQEKPARKKWMDRAIFITVFGLTGTSTAWIAAYVKPFLGLGKGTPFVVSAIYFVLFTLPLYQIVLLAWGWIFGRFHFFLDYEKRFFKRIGNYLKRKREK